MRNTHYAYIKNLEVQVEGIYHRAENNGIESPSYEAEFEIKHVWLQKSNARVDIKDVLDESDLNKMAQQCLEENGEL